MVALINGHPMGSRRVMSSARPRAAMPRAVVGIVLLIAVSIVSFGPARSASRADAVVDVIGRYRERIPELMAEQQIPGLAVALVDADEVLWLEGFGKTERHGGTPVTPNTLFSVQSTSKLFTATAVMQAVGAGLLDLDEPISTYVPEFTVNSAFEKHPEQRITLRMLLSHTAGFTHEAPVGNNNNLDPGDFDAHVRSISGTWLRFPAGTGYAYSNLGIDLAGYILERVKHGPFAAVLRASLLEPLGMERSTFDRAQIRSTTDRASGGVDPFPEPLVDVPMTAAGGLYSSAADLARFLRFQLNDGLLDGQVVLRRELMEEMRSIPAPFADARAGYALGVGRTQWNRWGGRPDLFNHGGGGFGFLSDLWWLPQLGIGLAVLTNSSNHQLQGELALSILGDLVAQPGEYRDRLLALPYRPPVVDPGRFVPPSGMADLVAAIAMEPTGDEAVRWADCVGGYRMPVWGVVSPFGAPDRMFVEAGTPYFEVHEYAGTERHRLVEVEPDLFLADNGETLDLRGSAPTWRGLPLVRVTGGPAGWQWAMLGLVAAIAAGWLVAAAGRTVRRLRSRSGTGEEAPPAARARRITGAVMTLTAMLSLATVGLIAWMPGLVDAGFLGWLHFSLAERVAMHLPLALAVLTACAVALIARGWAAGWWSKVMRTLYGAVAGAALVLVLQLATWGLIGWGFR